MCGGGSGAGGNTQYNWNSDLAPYWRGQLSQGNTLSQTPYQQYQGQRIAGMTPDQTTGFEEVRGLNQYAASPIPAMNAAAGQTQDTLNGQYLDANPYSVENQYSGFSPTFENVLNQGQNDIVNSYKNGTAADTTRLFNLSGAFGGSANQNAIANNEIGLGKTLDQYTSGMLNDQYNRSAGLQEQDLNRGSQNYENERQRQMGAIGLGNDQQSLALQRAQALTGVGDANRSYTQDLLNQGYGDWQNQQQWPFQMQDYMSGLLSRAQGGVSPDMNFQQSGYNASPFSQLLGAGLAGYGLFGGR